MVAWDDLNARARGLAGRLLGRARLRALTEAADLPSLVQGLDGAGYPVSRTVRPTSPADLELAVRRVNARRFAILVRWSGSRAERLLPLFEDEERRALRTLLRGAAAGTAPDVRTAPLIPTPGLPERALQELARQPTVAATVALLMAWEHPYASDLLEEARRTDPNLFRIELLINRRFFARALPAARSAGRVLEEHVQLMIDLENTWTALAVAGGEGGDAQGAFIPNGRWLSRADFERVVDAGADAGEMLMRAFRGTPLAGLPVAEPDVTRLEDAALEMLITRAIRGARRAPLSVAPVLAYLLRLRAEGRDLWRIIWAIALGAPRSSTVSRLVSPS